MIIKKAREIAGPSDFKTSQGWLYRFMKRKQVIETSYNCLPKGAKRLPLKRRWSASYIMMIKTPRLRCQYSFDSIFAMDETPWCDMLGSTTVATRGSCSVAVRSTGHEHSRYVYTVIYTLSARADGEKLTRRSISRQR